MASEISLIQPWNANSRKNHYWAQDLADSAAVYALKSRGSGGDDGLDLDSEYLSDVVALVLDLPCSVYGMGHGRLGRPARITVCFHR